MMIPQISPTEAKALLDANSAVFVDIRDPFSFQQGHIPGALHLDNSNVKQFLADTPRDQKIVVSCYNGNSSMGVTSFLQDQGFQDVASLQGGFTVWSMSFDVERG